jgi:hypothetical protein
MPYLSAFAAFREDVRRVAREQKGEAFFIARYTILLLKNMPIFISFGNEAIVT